MADTASSNPITESTDAKAGAKLVVLEVNEVPPMLFAWFASQRPESHISDLLAEGRLLKTETSDNSNQTARPLYPSQTWASLASGVPLEKHGIYWYGDPKPPEFPLYWQVAARHRNVGLCSTLHSSPLAEMCQADRTSPTGYDFVLPDLFGDEADAVPKQLAPLQSFNLSMTSKNARVVKSTFQLREYFKGLRAARQAGLGATTLARLARLAIEVASRRVPKERLRTAQFFLLSDVFANQLDRYRPDLAVFFTNHVAAAMHRYWPATFPEDWQESHWSDEWINRHRDEIPYAMESLDRFIGSMMRWCDAQHYKLVIMSSMGQVGGEEIDAIVDSTLVLRDPARFAKALDLPGSYEPQAGMVPQISYRFTDIADAETAERLVNELDVEDGSLKADRSGSTVTITYHLADTGSYLNFGGLTGSSQVLEIAEAGFERVKVDQHRAGTHHSEGTLVVWTPNGAGRNDPGSDDPDRVDYLEVAPAILVALGLAPLEHHMKPTFVI